MKTTMIIKNSNVTFLEDTKAPKIIIDSEKFFNDLNAELVKRYKLETETALENSKKSLSKAHEELKKVAVDSMEYEKISKRIDSLTEKIAGLETLLPQIVEESKKYKSHAPTSDVAEIVKFYSMLYSKTAGTKENKLIKAHISGTKNFFRLCKEYANTYENSAEWSEERSKAFKTLKEELVKIGSRLDGDATTNRKKFVYAVSAKDVNRLVALCTRRDDHNRNSGKFGEKIISFDAFENALICGIFRMDKSALAGNNEIEW